MQSKEKSELKYTLRKQEKSDLWDRIISRSGLIDKRIHFKQSQLLHQCCILKFDLLHKRFNTRFSVRFEKFWDLTLERWKIIKRKRSLSLLFLRSFSSGLKMSIQTMRKIWDQSQLFFFHFSENTSTLLSKNWSWNRIYGLFKLIGELSRNQASGLLLGFRKEKDITKLSKKLISSRKWSLGRLKSKLELRNHKSTIFYNLSKEITVFSPQVVLKTASENRNCWNLIFERQLMSLLINPSSKTRDRYQIIFVCLQKERLHDLRSVITWISRSDESKYRMRKQRQIPLIIQ